MEINFELLESRIVQMKIELLNIVNKKPGYYGSKGLILIGDVLSNLFLFNNLLAYDLVYPKKPIDYLQEVLVPETALHLISQNRSNITNISLEEARKIMEDSANFGDYVHKE
ncbi:hypothetical protein C1645_813743 [Glomus cerebriforme]|uniref:Restriction of telomere capping protein 4 n=1 Tax=Glomus cerebriforme TaxID=658196 RepID=A0A397TL93_9GLOM|nr:hypothetical protein C1645_813743 [Glomus cerebriforme]